MTVDQEFDTCHILYIDNFSWFSYCNLAVDIVKILYAGEYFEIAVNCSPGVKLMKLTAQLSFMAKL